MRIKTVADKTDNFEALWQCWTSQQMSHAQLELHLKDADFTEWYKAKIAGLDAVVGPSPPAPNADALAAEMLAGLEGVPAEQWILSDTYGGFDIYDQNYDKSVAFIHIDEDQPAITEHLLRCSPPNIRTLLTERATMKAEIERMREALTDAADQLALVHDDAFKQAAGYGLVTSDGRDFSCYQLNLCSTAATKARAALKGAYHDLVNAEEVK